ncbi:MAG: M42 family peptidase [Clostridia bacterium]|nr:M42 family peptidase [Clostridia bacterium]
MENIKQRLRALCEIPSVSGHESSYFDEILKVLTKEEKGSLDEIRTDSFGNLILVKKSNKENAPALMLDAHLDIIGFMVTEICDGGFLKIISIGGLDTRVLPATHVYVNGKEKIFGVITSTPPHLRKGDSQVPSVEDLMVDTGYSKEKLQELVSVGDTISFSPMFTPLLNNYVSGIGLDDKACVCAILDFITKVDKNSLEYDVYGVLSAQEETGKWGPARVAFNLDPDVAIITDVNFAKQKGVSENESIECGKGPSVDISSLCNRKLTKNIIRLFKENNLDHQIICEPGRTGTNNDAVSVSGQGIRTAILSVPLKSMHTPSEVVKLDDIKTLSKAFELIATSKEAL